MRLHTLVCLLEKIRMKTTKRNVDLTGTNFHTAIHWILML